MAANERHELEELAVRRKNFRIKFLLKILPREKTYPVFSSSYNDIVNQLQTIVQKRS